jgi:hypothetical protein
LAKSNLANALWRALLDAETVGRCCSRTRGGAVSWKVPQRPALWGIYRLERWLGFTLNAPVLTNALVDVGRGA